MLNQIKNVLIYTILCTFLYNSTVYAVSGDNCFDTADTKAMKHYNGSDGATSTTDSTGRTWTNNGNVQLDTAQVKFGSAASLFDGSGDFWSTADSDDLELGSGNFTIDFWIRMNALVNGTHYGFVTKTNSSGDTNGFEIGLDVSSGGTKFLYMRVNGTRRIDGTVTMVTGTWYHLAFIRDASNSWEGFFNGVSFDTYTGTDTITGNAVTMKVGDGVTDADMNGWIDEFRFVKGTAVWTDTFTPPSAEYVTPCQVADEGSSTFIGVSSTLQSY